MAWTTPLTAVSNATLTAAQWNASVRDNLNATAVALATTPGSYFATTGVNAIAERIMGYDRIDTSETTSSTSYGSLATAGPAATCTTGPSAIVHFTAQMTNNTAGSATLAYVNITGASAISLGDAGSITHEPGAANVDTTCSRSILYTGLTSGSNVFTMLYRVTANTGTWLRRTMVVMPL
jgi:hypothetical protein